MRFLLSVTLLLIGLNSVAAQTRTNNAISAVDNDNIREAVFRYQFQNNHTYLQKKAKVYFISVDGSDPDDSFIRRFKGNRPTVKKISEAKSSAHGVFDTMKGGQGISFSVGKIKQISAKEVEVHGGYYENGLSASGGIYNLKVRRGKWVVLGYHELVVA